jgi:hypothetical protein
MAIEFRSFLKLAWTRCKSSICEVAFMLIDVLQVMCSFWSSLDPSLNFRIVRGRRKKRAQEDSLGSRMRLKMGSKSYLIRTLKERDRNGLLMALLSSYGMIRYAILEVSPMSLCSKKNAF